MSEIELKPCPFEAKFQKGKPNKCWKWLGAVQSRGYGNFRGKLAHRYSYEKYIGAIPIGLTIDHLCRNTLCVNPAHLEPVTQKVNNLRGNSPAAMNKRKTHCSKGHEFAGDNLRFVVGKDTTRRKCKICQRMERKNAKARREEAA